MPSNFYDSAGDSGSATDTMPDTTEQDATSASEPGTNEGESTAPEEVISKSFLGGTPPKVGERFEVEITQVNEDSCLIKKADVGTEDEEGPGDETSGPEEAAEKRGGMMGDGMMGDGMMGEEKTKSGYYA